MLELEIPKTSKLIIIDKYNLIDIPNKNGIYYLYNNQNELLYIGKAKNLFNRVKDHVSGNTHTSRFHQEIYSIKYSVITSELDTDILETYLINKLNPKYNIAKKFKDAEGNDDIYSEEDEKTKYINFVVKLLRLNKNIPLGKYTIEQICKNNRIKFFNFYDKTVYEQLIKYSISITPKTLTWNT